MRPVLPASSCCVALALAYGKTVAVGVMGVTAWGTTLPLGGPYCFDP